MQTLRVLSRQPTFVALSLLTLALAVGANLVVFSIVNAIWLRPRPVHEPERVVMVMSDTSAFGSSETFYFAELGLQRQVRDVPAFEGVAGQVMTSGGNWGLAPRVIFEAVGHPVEALGVTSEYFGVLGLPIRGRDFARDDDRYGAPPVAIISDKLWKTVFNAQPGVIGSVVPASPLPMQIIGVAPPGFSGARLGEQADLWVPRNLVPYVSSVPQTAGGSPAMQEGAINMLAIARLRPGVTPSQAEHLIEQQGTSLTRLTVVPISEIFGSPVHRTLILNEGPLLRLVIAASLIVLAGGCATLMALVFVHYERRRHEFAVRLALGASAWRLCRQLGTELLWLVVAGSICAGLIATWGLSVLPALNTPAGISLSRLDLHLDWRVVLAGITMTTVTMLVATALPMRRFTAYGIAPSLVSATSTASLSSLRLRQGMLAAHATSTVIVLVAAGLFVRTVEYGFSQGAGFDVAQTLFIDVAVGTPYDLGAMMMSEPALRSPADRRDQSQRLAARAAERLQPTIQRILDDIGRQPGVRAVAMGPAPISSGAAGQFASTRTIEVDSTQHSLRVGSFYASADYVKAIGLRLLAGRTFTTADTREAGTPGPVMITASLAETLWPGQSPIGRHFWAGRDQEVVGVVEDFAFGSLRVDPRYAILGAVRPAAASGNLRLAVSADDPESIVEPLRRTISAIVPDSPRLNFTTGLEMIAADLGHERLGAWFFSGFGLVATSLGIGGVFGLVAYLAESRRREFGIRAALGATTSRMVWMAMRAGLMPVAAGTLAGLLGAMWLGKAAESFLIGVRWFDPFSYAISVVVMVGCAAAAGLTAGSRIRRIALVDALRTE